MMGPTLHSDPQTLEEGLPSPPRCKVATLEGGRQSHALGREQGCWAGPATLRGRRLCPNTQALFQAYVTTGHWLLWKQSFSGEFPACDPEWHVGTSEPRWDAVRVPAGQRAPRVLLGDAQWSVPGAARRTHVPPDFVSGGSFVPKGCL